ncbi:MAG: cupin [Cyanobacteria bacterium P01_H01_bin.152]
MENRNLLVTDEGVIQSLDIPALPAPEQTYRLYRFLTELEDLLAAENNDAKRLMAIAPMVRQLLVSSYWLQMEYQEPNPKTGWGVHFLYREYQFPLTVQMVAWSPGSQSTIHNHATWGVVAMLGGHETNRIWRRNPTANHPHQIELVDEVTLAPGDIITFTPGAIHQVQPSSDEPTISFNLYGITNRQQRYVFNLAKKTAELF